MTRQVVRPAPSAEELAAILAVLASVSAPAEIREPVPSRWKLAARAYASGTLREELES